MPSCWPLHYAGACIFIPVYFICKPFQLPDKALVRAGTRPTISNHLKGWLETQFMFPNQIGDDNATAPGNPGSAVHQHVPILDVLVDEGESGSKEDTDLLFRVILHYDPQMLNWHRELQLIPAH